MNTVPAATPTMHDLRPFWGYLTAIDSPVDEVERASGLIVPVDEKNTGVRRAIVLHVSDRDAHGDALPLDILPAEGSPVYFRGGITVGDVIVVRLTDIVAFIP